MTYIAVSALSHMGVVRDHHEDSLVAAGPWTLCATVTKSLQTLFFPLGTPLVVAVADGLGHPAGEVASAMAARRLAQIGPFLDSQNSVREALDAGNREVHAAPACDPALTTMGTTVAGVVVTADRVLAFNVGNGRVYAAGPGGVRQLSTDDRLSGEDLPPGARRE